LAPELRDLPIEFWMGIGSDISNPEDSHAKDPSNAFPNVFFGNRKTTTKSIFLEFIFVFCRVTYSPAASSSAGELLALTSSPNHLAHMKGKQ